MEAHRSKLDPLTVNMGPMPSMQGMSSPSDIISQIFGNLKKQPSPRSSPMQASMPHGADVPPPVPSPALQNLMREVLEWSVFPHDERIASDMRNAIQSSLRIKQRKEAAAAAAAMLSPPASPGSVASGGSVGSALSRSPSMAWQAQNPFKDNSRPKSIREEYHDVHDLLTGQHKWNASLRSGGWCSTVPHTLCWLACCAAQ